MDHPKIIECQALKSFRTTGGLLRGCKQMKEGERRFLPEDLADYLIEGGFVVATETIPKVKERED